MRTIIRSGAIFCAVILVCGFQSFAFAADAKIVEVRDNQLVVEGVKQPQLFGAELQYFRLRGGYEANVPRARVLALWNKALDRMVEAGMNTVSFYIPWDFHEYDEGKFDFTGTADADGDGRADYPSRDVITFFKLIADHGITRIMVRPGPYINAEWGFLGFGAIPEWFHKKFPSSHMRNPYGLTTKLYDYHNADLLKHSGLWFSALNQQVLKNQMGPGKPIVFLQLDNETNFQWQPLYSQGYETRTIARYQEFLSERYKNLNSLNEAHGRIWSRWAQIQPPFFPGRNVFEDQEWYRFSDWSIYSYLNKVRSLWTSIGIEEPNVMFTLAESYNAPRNGLLPHYAYRNAKGVTGLMTVNLYPKTFEEPEKPLLNLPFKADLDVKSADEANDSYFGSRQEWVLGPEIQGGWWRGITVSPEARQQTYLTVIGHGMKALYVYYFNEGQNWGAEWAHGQIEPMFKELVRERRLEHLAVDKLPEDFWNELQWRTDRKILVGFDVRRIMKLGPKHDYELFFDAPLDGNANPRGHFFDLKRLGQQVVVPHRDFLARSLELHDEVALVKDSVNHEPAHDPNIIAENASAEWAGGLLGYLMNADVNPRILFGDVSRAAAFNEPKVLVHLDAGRNSPRTLELLKNVREKTILNFLGDEVPRALGLDNPSSLLVARKPGAPPAASTELEFYVGVNGELVSKGTTGATAYKVPSSNPVYEYALNTSDCSGVLYRGDKIVGYRCVREGARLIQIGALLFEDYNSGAYTRIALALERDRFLKLLLPNLKVNLELLGDAPRTVAFARVDPSKELIWITVKTGSSVEISAKIRVDEIVLNNHLKPRLIYRVTELLTGRVQNVKAADLSRAGFLSRLKPNGSAVYSVK